MQWRAGIGNVFVVLPALFVIWCWYGFAVHPVLFGRIIIFFMVGENVPIEAIWFGWLLLFPLAVGSLFLLYGWFYGMGMRTSFFTFARGRVRFNRITRKVYVLRPAYCGGNKIFEWDNLVALMRRVPDDHPMASKIIGSLVLYQPPTDPGDWLSEDAIFAGPSLYLGELQAAPMWEYIRLYMEEGPTIDAVPQNPPDDFRQIPRFLPERYFTYCGMPSAWQYGLEQRPGMMETTFHMMSQVTCTWPRFPPEWESDSGMGEPEDRPVQTGAVMTALVYRAQGRMSKQDEVAFLTHWGTEEALAEAMKRPD
ncbi:hypothetical protein VVAX_00166 [Variovorax paradoxus]|uniref:Transmembrane protein n=2 Tax=Variovorax paradoxus TaxID=34073 RepID=A0A679IKX4_VARPD|nr:hypothetical protein VVAX_00166 [Variovorax paradoxus]